MNIQDLLRQTFSGNDSVLPSIESLRTLVFDGQMMEMILNRPEYISRSYPVLTDDLLKGIFDFVKTNEINQVIELNAGLGWLSHWMLKYDIPVVKTVDDMTWEFSHPHLEIVEKADSLQTVQKTTGEHTLFVLSWPPLDDPIASHIWEAMKPGQCLLYIGEWEGGCTADDRFFDLVEDHEVQEIDHVSWDQIYDRAMIFRRTL